MPVYKLIHSSTCIYYCLKSFLALITGGVLLLSCKAKQPDLPQAILSVKETGQLVTAEYTLSKIIKANDNKTWYKIGDRKILMSCEASVKAGINFQNITENNFQWNDSVLTVKLPPAQVFSLNIPPDKIQVEYEEVDVLRQNFSAAEREMLLAQAEAQIKSLASSLGILQTAETNGIQYVKSLLEQSGFKKVKVYVQ